MSDKHLSSYMYRKALDKYKQRSDDQPIVGQEYVMDETNKPRRGRRVEIVVY